MSAPPQAAPPSAPPVTGDTPTTAATLAARAMDPKQLAEVEAAIQQLTPDEAAHFLGLITRAIKRRKIQLVGYLFALVVLLGGQVGALVYFGMSSGGSSVGWVFLVPFLLVGVVFWLFGRWARQYE